MNSRQHRRERNGRYAPSSKKSEKGMDTFTKASSKLDQDILVDMRAQASSKQRTWKKMRMSSEDRGNEGGQASAKELLIQSIQWDRPWAKPTNCDFDADDIDEYDSKKEESDHMLTPLSIKKSSEKKLPRNNLSQTPSANSSLTASMNTNSLQKLGLFPAFSKE